MNSIENTEHLTLKYISFLYKFNGNSPKAYYELKLYLSRKIRSSSSYFLMIAKVISNAIENKINLRTTSAAESS